MVVAIVADRIGQPDAHRGFILDGFPRTVAQAEALDRMLKEKGLELDAVIELKVDEAILLQRIEKRVAEMAARGEPLRADDNAEALKKRLDAYRSQTAPLIGYYAGKGMLRTIDGMAPIDEVSAALAALLEPGCQAGVAAAPAGFGGAAQGGGQAPERSQARGPVGFGTPRDHGQGPQAGAGTQSGGRQAPARSGQGRDQAGGQRGSQRDGKAFPGWQGRQEYGQIRRGQSRCNQVEKTPRRIGSGGRLEGPPRKPE